MGRLACGHGHVDKKKRERKGRRMIGDRSDVCLWYLWQIQQKAHGEQHLRTFAETCVFYVCSIFHDSRRVLWTYQATLPIASAAINVFIIFDFHIDTLHHFA